MDPEERKFNQRIVKRKGKVKKMITEQEAIIKGMDPSAYQHHMDYLRDLSSASHKLHRLQQELIILESGHLTQDI